MVSAPAPKSKILLPLSKQKQNRARPHNGRQQLWGLSPGPPARWAGVIPLPLGRWGPNFLNLSCFFCFGGLGGFFLVNHLQQHYDFFHVLALRLLSVSGRSRSRFWALPGGAAMLFCASGSGTVSWCVLHMSSLFSKLSKRRGTGTPALGSAGVPAPRLSGPRRSRGARTPALPHATGVALWSTQ